MCMLDESTLNSGLASFVFRRSIPQALCSDSSEICEEMQ